MPPIPPHKAPGCSPRLAPVSSILRWREPLAGREPFNCLLANTLNQDLSLRPPKVSRRPGRLPPIRAARRAESRLPAAF